MPSNQRLYPVKEVHLPNGSRERRDSALYYCVREMDATQTISDSILESDEEESEEENKNKSGKPLATLCILKNDHIPEREIPLFLGENVLGRDPNTCSLPLPSPSISKQHATISISAFRRRGKPSEVDVEALIWDLGSLNGTRKGRLKLTPNVRYALSDCDNLVVADIPCQYVSLSAHKVTSHFQFKMPATRVSGAKATVDDLLKEEESGGKKCVNGTPETRSRPDVKDGGENRLSTYLFFEQTPAQSQKTLVPESDLDSDDEEGGRGDGRRKTLASLSDSCKSTPTSSHLLSPLNQTVPESEDESPKAPSDLDKNRPLRHVDFNQEETDAYVGRQELRQQGVFAFVDDSDDEEEEKEEGVAMEHIISDKIGPLSAAHEKDEVAVQEADKSLMCTSAVFPNATPALNMDSDTDVEGEEGEEEKRVPPAAPVTSSTDQLADGITELGLFHMDSDTDVDEDNENEVQGCLPSAAAKPSHDIPAVKAEDIYMDSDTDAEDDAEKKGAPRVSQSAHTGTAAASRLKNFNLDSDTDVEEEPEKEVNQTPSKPVMKAVNKASLTAPPFLQTDSETDDEAAPVAAHPKDCSQKIVAVDDPTRVSRIAVTASSLVPAALSGSEADTDVDESSGPPVGNRVYPAAGLHMDSDTDFEDEGGVGVATEDQVPSLCRTNTPGFQDPQKCSTPVFRPAEKVENMETQAFLSSFSPPFQVAQLHMTGSKAKVSCSDSLEDNVLAVAETQPFVPQTKESHVENLVCPESSAEEGASFQLGLSDSSQLRERAQALAMESTQAFVLGEEATRSPPSSSQPVLSGNDALQVCVEDTLRQGVNVALEATQAYISGHCSASEGETEDCEAGDVATVETQAFNLPTSFTLAMAETQPMCVLQEEGISDERENDEVVPLMPKRGDDQTQPLPETQPVLLIDEEEIKNEDSMPLLRKRKAKPLQLEEEQTQPLASCDLGLLETQPMSCNNDEEIKEEDSMPLLQKRKAKPLQLEEEQTQPLASCDLGLLETQPMSCNNDEEIKEEDLRPVLRRRKAKLLELEEEERQPITSCNVPLIETQPVSFVDDNDDDSVPVLQRSEAKPLQSEDKQKQPHANFDVGQLETQPVSFIVDNDDGDDDDDEDSLPNLQKRKARPLEQLEEEQTQPLSSCDRTLAETQPVHLEVRDEQSDEDDLVPRPRRKRTRALPSQDEETQTLVGSVGSDLSSATQPGLTGEDGDSDDSNSVIGFSRRKAKPLESQEEESQTLSLTASEKPSLLADDIDESEDVDSSLSLCKRKASPLAIKEDDSQSLTGPAVSASGTRLSQTEAAGQGGDDTSQSESRGGTSRDPGEEIPKLRQEGAAESAGSAETPHRQTGEKSSPHKNDTRKVEMDNVEKNQAKGKVPKMQKEYQVEENIVSRNGGLTKEQQATEIDTSNEKQHMERSEEKKMQMVRTHRKGKNVSEKEKKPELEHEKLATVNRKEEDEEKTDGEEKEKEQLDKKRDDKEQPELEKTEREQKKLEVEEKEKLANDRQEKKENSALPKAEMGRKVSARAKDVQEKCIDHQQENQSSVPAARGRRATRRTTAATRSVEPEHHVNSDDVPARRTRSRSNSTNSVSSERSTADPDSQQSQGRGRGRGRGRGARRSSTVPSNSSSSRKSTTTAPPSKRNSRARSQMEVKSECTEEQVTTLASPVGEGQRRGRKRTSGVDTHDVPSVSCKISKPAEEEKKEEEEEKEEEAAQNEVPAQPIRGGRGRAKKAPVTGTLDEVEAKSDDVAAAGRRQVRGRSVVANQRRKDKQDANDRSMVEPELPCTPVGGASRKRQAAAASSPAAKTPRSSSASPASRTQSRLALPTYKVLFTGVVDQVGEKVLARLGGCMAKGVADMTCLVTDKVRRTVKFLCALAKGVPIVTTDWLEKCGKAGSFLPTEPFLVKDPEQEKKFNFCLKESLRVASSQPVLQGYKVHVTKSVKPEPVHMKDIFSCCGATFLPKMPSSQKPQTVVVSCEEDWQLCAPALSASVPVVTAEFILTGILQQKLDVQKNLLSSPANAPQPVGGRGQSRRKN